MRMQFILPAAAALALGSTIAALSPSSVLAQQPSPPQSAAPQQPARPPQAQRPARSFASHVEGRIAFLKAEIKITPAQEAAFDKVAQAMRDNAADDAKDLPGSPRSRAVRLIRRSIGSMQ